MKCNWRGGAAPAAPCMLTARYLPAPEALRWARATLAIHFSCRCVGTVRHKTFAELGIELREPSAGTRLSSSGMVSAKMNFKEYLAPGRVEMYEAGKIRLNDPMKLKGCKLTLEQLRANC